MNKNLRTSLIVIAVVIVSAVVFWVALSPLKAENDTKNIKNSEDVKITATTKYNKIVKKYDVSDKLFAPEFGKHSYYDYSADGLLYYRMSLPEKGKENKKSPVLLLLHSESGMGMDNERQLDGITTMFEASGDILSDAIVICPQTNSGWSLDLYYPNDERGDLGSVKHLTDEIIKKHNGDPSRIYVIGVSAGAVGVWSLLERYPDYFAAAVPISSWGDIRECDFSKIPIWMFHGAADPSVSSYGSWMIYNSVINSGGDKIKLTELPNIGHDAWKYVFADRKMFSWMFSQKKNTHQSLDYDYKGCFEVVAPDGKVILNEKDITDASSTVDGKDEYGKLDITDSAAKRLKKEYAEHKNKVFTVKYCSQSLYTYIPIKAPDEDIFRLELPLAENENYCMLLSDMIYGKNKY